MDARSSGLGRARSDTRAPERPHATPLQPPRLVRLARRFDALTRSAATEPGDAAAVRRFGLFAYTGATIVLGLGMLVWTTLQIPIAPAIDPGLDGTALAGSLGGALLWIMFGFLGSLRVLRAPGGAGVLTFHLPFVAAATVLGGPTAGAWVAFLSTIERREIEQQPWYGVLGNHSVFVIGAVLGGLAAQAIGSLASGATSPGLATALAAITGTLVLTVITTGMAVVTVTIRDELSVAQYLEFFKGQLGRLNAIEVAIAWVLVVAYVQLAWWAPAVIGALILLVWDNHPMPAPDPLTGLHNLEGFNRKLDQGLGRLRRGIVPGATVFGIDLNYFKTVNTRYGHEVGNEVLAQVGARLRAQARRPSDVAARVGGDEFALFLPGLVDVEVAMRRAEEVAEAMAAPFATTAGPVVIGASVGVVVIPASGMVPARGTILRHADGAMYQAKASGGGAHLYTPGEPAPFDDMLEAMR